MYKVRPTIQVDLSPAYVHSKAVQTYIQFSGSVSNRVGGGSRNTIETLCVRWLLGPQFLLEPRFLGPDEQRLKILVVFCESYC